MPVDLNKHKSAPKAKRIMRRTGQIGQIGQIGHVGQGGHEASVTPGRALP